MIPQSEIDELKEAARIHQKNWSCIAVKIDCILRLIAGYEKMREALKYYADLNRWESTTHDSTRDGVGCGDFESHKIGIGQGYEQVGGKRARQTLAEVGGEK